MIIDNKTFIETVASNLVNDIYDNLGTEEMYSEFNG